MSRHRHSGPEYTKEQSITDKSVRNCSLSMGRHNMHLSLYGSPDIDLIACKRTGTCRGNEAYL